MASSWEVVDSEGRCYGHYPSREAAQDAASSAGRGFPWRAIRTRPVAGAEREALPTHLNLFRALAERR